MILRLATNAMGTRFELALEVGGGDDEPALRAIGEEALREIELWHGRLSAFDPASDTSRLNRHAASEAWAEPLPIDTELAEFLSLCRDVHLASDGAFDPAIGRTMEALGFRDEPEASAPGLRAPDTQTPRSRSGLVPTPTFSSLLLSPSSISFSVPHLRLDFGAVGKGWALDRAADILRAHHITSALLHAGTSSVIAIGPPGGPLAPPHTIRVRSDTDPLDVQLRDASLGVSAPRGRTVEHQGRQLGHVIDPRTGIPADASSVDTAVVLCGSPAAAALCDAWSTAALVLGHSPPNLPPGFAARLHTPLGWTPWGGITVPPSSSAPETA